MWAKLPTGWVGSEPSGRFAAASGSGVPHHGGASCAAAVPAMARAATSAASAASKLLCRPAKGEHLLERADELALLAMRRRPVITGHRARQAEGVIAYACPGPLRHPAVAAYDTERFKTARGG